MELAVLGKNDFALGFRLAGIRNVSDYHDHDNITNLLGNSEIGVVIIDQATFDNLSDNVKEEVINSIKPVFVVVSAKPQEELRRMIIRSIGVDLLRDEN
jgi:V/A-type H+/Na+-transporting ATPase subunit F